MSFPKFRARELERGWALRWNDDVWRTRSTSHLAIICLVILAIVLGSTRLISFPERRVNRPSLSLVPRERAVPANALLSADSGEELAFTGAPIAQDGNVLGRLAVPHTIIPERPRVEITHYVVKPGDTILGIAAQFGITGQTVMWANGSLEDNPDLLRVGQEVIVLPVNGVFHQVGPNDTVSGIASTFKVDPSAIVNFPLNELDAENPTIQVGQWLVVPGGTKPYIPKQVVAYAGTVPEGATSGTGSFGWPASGQLSQGYWDRHRGIDVASWKGAPVLAADSGYVVAAGWDDSGYGRVVLIDHGNGFQTLYAHLDSYYVETGASVSKGQQIGEIGDTGNTTGPHLHFEIRANDVQRNPFGFLP